MKKSFLTAMFFSFTVLLAACGNVTSATTTKAGPSSATQSGYYFNISLSPNIVTKGNGATATVTVWTGSSGGGAAASGVTVYFSGDISSTTATTNAAGVASASVTPTSAAGAIGTVIATVENQSLPVSFQVRP